MRRLCLFLHLRVPYLTIGLDLLMRSNPMRFQWTWQLYACRSDWRLKLRAASRNAGAEAVLASVSGDFDLFESRQ